MNVLRSIGVLFVVASAVAGCSSESDDGKRVAGRTRSLATAANSEQGAFEGTVRRRRATAQGTGLTTASFTATLRAADATAAILRLPSGEELPLIEGDAETMGAELTGTPAELEARCPDGAYTFAGRLVDGSTTSLTLAVVGPAQVAPTIVSPGDMAIVPPGALPVAWTWEGTAGLFDVTLSEVTTGEVLYRASDLAGREHVVPAGVIAPAHRYRLLVAAASASEAAAVRLETATTIELDVSAP